MVGLFAALALFLTLRAQDPPPPTGLSVQFPSAAARDRCARRSDGEPRQVLEMRCRISDGRVAGDCEHMNPTPATSRRNVATAQCILRATRWFRDDGSPASDVTMTQTYTLGTR